MMMMMMMMEFDSMTEDVNEGWRNPVKWASLLARPDSNEDKHIKQNVVGGACCEHEEEISIWASGGELWTRQCGRPTRRLKDNSKTHLEYEYLTRECVYRIYPATGQGQATRASGYGNEALGS
jgi:hypothetical protein